MTGEQLDITVLEPVLPYAGTSGWSGSDTSRARAITADSTGTTSERQNLVLRRLQAARENGVTWAELSRDFQWHHGTASGVLSVLHKEGLIVRLSDRRDKCKIYVLERHVDGRATEPHGRKRRPCSNCGHLED